MADLLGDPGCRLVARRQLLTLGGSDASWRPQVIPGHRDAQRSGDDDDQRGDQASRATAAANRFLPPARLLLR
jgi:hypothetical protein